MIACWTFYIQGVRRAPKTEEWYDEGDVNGSESDGALFVYPYGSLVIGTASAFVLFGIMNLPEPVETVLLVLCMAAGGHRNHWFYGRVRDSTSVAVCASVGRRYPQSQTRSTPRTQRSPQEGKEGLTKLVQIRLTNSRRYEL